MKISLSVFPVAVFPIAVFPIVAFPVIGLAISCSISSARAQDRPTLGDIDISTSSSGVVLLPDDVPRVFRDVFVRYTKVVAPNGKPIHFLAQDGWSEARVVKARKVLEHMLTDAPDSEYGADKTRIANAMADRRATMVLFNTEPDLRQAFRGPLRRVDLRMQDLRANECPVEGSEDYMRHDTRDASYEEILHLIHDYGIKPVLPEYQSELRASNDAATARDIWEGWPDEDEENHPNEYIGVLYDNYLDLWSPPPTKYEGRVLGPEDIPEGSSHFGRFQANSRARLAEVDPSGYEMVEKFFPRYLTYAPELPAEFTGTFSIQLDPSLRYTYKSQHLKDVTLTGTNDANLTGNVRDNVLIGNDGENMLRGGPGNDLLDGGEGTDTALYVGDRADYTVHQEPGFVRVVDHRVNRDGIDVLVEIEVLRFNDGVVRLD